MTVGTKIGLETARSEPDTALAGQRDELYHWENVSFLVEGFLFRVPRYHFIVGSEWFATKYLRVVEDWTTVSGASDTERPSHDKAAANDTVVVLEDVAASQFRTFLKLLFPIHSTSTTLTLTKPEWLTILTLSTRWHFLEFRGLAIRHLHPQMTDPIEMIRVGRAEYVPRWVAAGYAALVGKSDVISEEESEAIGDRTAVRLYIIRHELASRCVDVDREERSGIPELLGLKFAEELRTLKLMEDQRKSEAEVRREREEAEAEREGLAQEERIRLAEEAERVRLAQEEERIRPAKKAERKRLAKEAIAHQLQEKLRRIEEEKRVAKLKVEEEVRQAQVGAKTKEEEDKTKEEEGKKKNEAIVGPRRVPPASTAAPPSSRPAPPNKSNSRARGLTFGDLLKELSG